jgi:hypothetical protein
MPLAKLKAHNPRMIVEVREFHQASRDAVRKRPSASGLPGGRIPAGPLHPIMYLIGPM